MERIWLKHYPAGVPAEIDPDRYASLVALLEESFREYPQRPAYVSLGRTMTFAEVDELSQQFAAWLQTQGLEPGDRVAVMLPNVLQYPVAVAAILRAGMVVVNVNPLYTATELRHQLQDSGARAIVILENFAATLQQCLADTPVKKVVLAAMGDLLGFSKGMVVNYTVRSVRKLVPPFHLPAAVRFNHVLSKGRRSRYTPVTLSGQDIAVLQYTGGTTGISKGAALTHRNLIANMLQSEAWNEPAMRRIPANEQYTSVCVLPLYHIFAFTVNMLLNLRTGGCNILIPNARDIPAVLKEMAKRRFHTLPAVNTLFNALLHHPDFGSVNWKHLRLAVGGGMAVQEAVARRWLDKTGCPICEGYGLSETSPSVTCNPVDSTAYSGSIGLPLPSTEVSLLDDDHRPVEAGQPGEIAVRGPQVMAGYWQRPDETAKVMTSDGWFLTGDIGTVDERGYFRIVDRKKDMILVSGFNVYPNEVEDVVAKCPGVLECAAIGIPDEKSGEAVKLFVVRKDDTLTEQQLRAHCEQHLTGYKRPRVIEFRRELPKTPVGKILRRELRGPAADTRIAPGSP